MIFYKHHMAYGMLHAIVDLFKLQAHSATICA